MVDPELQPFLAAARQEQSIRGLGLTDRRSMFDVIWADFVTDVAPWAELDYEQDVNPRNVHQRLLEAERLDFLIVANPAQLDEAGLVQTFDQPYRELYPKGWTDPRSRWLPLYVQPTVAVFNRHHVAIPPTDWELLADPRWADTLVFDAPWRMVTSGPAFAELRSVLGERAWERYLNNLANGTPLLVGDNERSVLEVATGRRWVGLSIWNVARRVRPSSPVGFTFIDPTPCIPGFVVMGANSTHPHLVRLFLAWLGSPGGQTSYARTGRIPALPDVEAPSSLARVVPNGIDALYGTVDWLTDPEPFVTLYRSIFQGSDDGLPAGKLS